MLEFDGARDPKVFLDWLRAIERKFDYKNYDERKRYKFAVHQFTERAALWYEKLKARRRREGKGKIKSWEKLKKHLKRKFLPRDYEQKLYFQRIKSQIVRRKQEERKRLFLDTRDPPKPAKIEKSDAYLAAIEEEVEKIKKSLQEAHDAAMKAQQQQDELVCDSKPTSNLSTSKEVRHDQEQQQTMAEIPHLALVKSPTKPEIEAVQGDPKQPLVLLDQTDLCADFREHCVQKESSQILFQEREDKAQRKHDGVQRKKQRSYKQRAFTAALHHEDMFMSLLFTKFISWNVHARSGLKLLIYDSRTNLFKKGSLMREHKQERQASIKPHGRA